MTNAKYARFVRNMDEPPTVDTDDVVYGAEIVTGDGASGPDTVVLVTTDRVMAGPIAGMAGESRLDFDLALADLESVECEGFFSETVSLETADDRYLVPSRGMDAVDFTCNVVEHSHLTNRCERFGFGRTRFAVCKWSACLGCALILVGVGFSITMIGILVGLPFIGAGAALLLVAFAYKKLGEYMEDNVWTREEIEQPNAV